RGPAPHAHRPGGGPVISRLVPAIAVVVVVTDAALLATGVIGPAVALALFLAVEIPLGAIAVTDYVRRYRAHARTSGSRRGALRGLAADDPYLRMFVAEARTFASLGRWVARRPDVPDGAVAIGYSRGTLGVPVALVIAALIEPVADRAPGARPPRHLRSADGAGLARRADRAAAPARRRPPGAAQRAARLRSGAGGRDRRGATGPPTLPHQRRDRHRPWRRHRAR